MKRSGLILPSLVTASSINKESEALLCSRGRNTKEWQTIISFVQNKFLFHRPRLKLVHLYPFNYWDNFRHPLTLISVDTSIPLFTRVRFKVFSVFSTDSLLLTLHLLSSSDRDGPSSLTRMVCEKSFSVLSIISNAHRTSFSLALGIKYEHYRIYCRL